MGQDLMKKEPEKEQEKIEVRFLLDDKEEGEALVRILKTGLFSHPVIPDSLRGYLDSWIKDFEESLK